MSIFKKTNSKSEECSYDSFSISTISNCGNIIERQRREYIERLNRFIVSAAEQGETRVVTDKIGSWSFLTPKGMEAIYNYYADRGFNVYNWSSHIEISWEDKV